MPFNWSTLAATLGIMALLGSGFFWWGQLEGKTVGLTEAAASERVRVVNLDDRLDTLTNRFGVVEWRLGRIEDEQKDVKAILKELKVRP